MKIHYGGIEFKKLIIKEFGNTELETLRTGICGTDREIVKGKLQLARPEIGNELILGHEAVARVSNSDNSEFKSGDIVVPVVRLPGSCRICKLGRQDYCEDGEFVESGVRGKNGFMRKKFYYDSKFLVKVSNSNIKDLAVLTEPLKNVMKMVEIFNFQRYRIPWFCEDSTLSCKNLYVFGTGTEGLLASVIFKREGLNVIAVNRHPVGEKVLNFLEHNGIEFFDSSKENIAKKKKDLSIDFAIDAVGSMEILETISINIRNNGIVILFGTSGQNKLTNKDLITSLVDKNISITGTVDGSKKHYEEAIKFLSDFGEARNLRNIITGVVEPTNLSVFERKGEDEIKTIIEWEGV